MYGHRNPNPTALVLAALLSAVIAISLHPLGILKKRVQDISDGHLGVQAPAKGRDEVGEITRVFNTMSRNVEFRDKEIRLTSEGYSRFVPDRVFGLLEKSSVIDVRLEDQTSVEATVLNCSVGAFDDIARSLRSREMFRLRSSSWVTLWRGSRAGKASQLSWGAPSWRENSTTATERSAFFTAPARGFRSGNPRAVSPAGARVRMDGKSASSLSRAATEGDVSPGRAGATR